MKIKLNFLSKLKGGSSSKQEKYYYETLDELPLYNWIECQRGEIKFVRKGDSGTSEQDEMVWMDIYDEYIKQFGLGKLHIKNKGSGITIEQTLVHLSKWIGHWLNTKTLKAKEYFNLVREFERYNKQSNGEANKGK